MTVSQAIIHYSRSQKNWITALYAKRQLNMLGGCILGGDLLDIGCGAGVVEAAYGDRAKSITSCDIEDQNLYGLDIDICSADSLPYSDSSYDMITMLGVVEHLERPKAAIAECGRVLKNRGRIIISIPNGHGWWILRNIVGTSNLHAYFNQNDLYQLMDEWKLIEKRPIIYGLFWVYEYEVIK
jgi:2-polyprenyl-3-methyl-5-hydroxy-6-metoxy-1,4-benzoquinol methylase